MKSIKKTSLLLSIGAIAAAPIAVASSCGGETNSSTTFDVGLELAYAPYNFLVTQDQHNQIIQDRPDAASVMAETADGQWGAGYDVYVANQIGEAYSQPVMLHSVEWDSLIPELNANSFDAIIAGMSRTAEREKQITFSNNTYMQPELGILYNDTLDITVKYPETSTIFAQKGTSHADLLSDQEDDNGSPVVSPLSNYNSNTNLDNAQALVAEVRGGNGIAIMESVIGIPEAKVAGLSFISFADLAANNVTFLDVQPGTELPTEAEDICVAVSKSEDSRPFLTSVNSVITSSFNVINNTSVSTEVNYILNYIRGN